jgi:thiosulfate/3-mercaptopyruvate sulfurtransferase
VTLARFALAAATLAASLTTLGTAGPRHDDPPADLAHRPALREEQVPAGDDAPLVVDAGWLRSHLQDRNLVLLHVGDRAQYDSAHIPGARFVRQQDVAVSSHDHEKGLMLELPSADSLRTVLAGLGISDDSRVVVYYGGDWVSPATRIVFTLDHAGLGARTSLLDGGMRAWVAAGGAVTKEVSAARAGSLSPLRTKPLVVDAAWVRSRIGRPGVAIVDARAASFYDGIEATGPRKGRIPSAKSVPFTELAGDDLRIRTRVELAARFAKAGVAPGDTIVGVCHIGQQATAMLFAARLTGHPVRLYDGSMQEWSRRTELPIELPR